MPRKPKPEQEHRIPVNDGVLFEALRAYALRHDLTWVDAMRKLLTDAERVETLEHHARVREGEPLP